MAWAIDNFAGYLRGRKFTLFTDHKPLETLSTMHTKTLNRLQQQLLEFDFDIQYKEGKENRVADMLSNNTLAALNDNSGTLRQAQTADALCGGVREFLQFGCVPSASTRTEQRLARQAQSCFLTDGLVWHILKRNKQRTRNIILAPESMHRKILEAAHSSWVAVT